HGGRQQIDDPHQPAQNARTLRIERCGEFAHLWRQGIVKQALVPEEASERDEGAPRMVDADEGTVRDDVERLRATVLGMRPPADVGQQAGRAAIARLVLRLLYAEGGECLARPFCKLSHMGDGPGPQYR